jgi:hypothetical protein
MFDGAEYTITNCVRRNGCAEFTLLVDPVTDHTLIITGLTAIDDDGLEHKPRLGFGYTLPGLEFLRQGVKRRYTLSLPVPSTVAHFSFLKLTRGAFGAPGPEFRNIRISE